MTRRRVCVEDACGGNSKRQSWRITLDGVLARGRPELAEEALEAASKKRWIEPSAAIGYSGSRFIFTQP